MYALKATWVGRTFAQAKPNESGGKKSRVRIPKEERKAMVESFIKKHQKLNNGNFPSLSLTHREVGGSFYTVREIVREIIQENRVLGAGESIPEKKGNDWEPKQSQSDSIFMEPVVPPLSMHQNGSQFTTGREQSMTENLVVVPRSFSSDPRGNKTLENGENINGVEVGLKEKESDMLDCKELKASVPSQENTGLEAQNSLGSISETSKGPFPVPFNGNHVVEHDVGMQEKMEKLNDNFSTKPGDQKLENGKCVEGVHLDVDCKDRETGSIILGEPGATQAVEVEEIVEQAATTRLETVNKTENFSGIMDTVIDISESVTVEMFPLRPNTCLRDSSNKQSSHSENICDGVKGIGTDNMTSVANSSSGKALDLEEISLGASAVPDEKVVEGIVGQLENKISDPLEKTVGENFVNTSLTKAECTNTKDSIALDVLAGNTGEIEESDNGIWNPQKIENQPMSSNEPGSAEKDITNKATLVGNEATVTQKATLKPEKVDALDSSISQMESSNAALNRIKPESWKGAPKNIAKETHPFLAALKSFLTAFIKFWTE